MTTKMPKIPKPEYYYYSPNIFTEARIRSVVNVNALMQDLQRGVTTLSEEAYCRGWGSTQTSLAFAVALIKVLEQAKGQDGVTARRADMTLSDKHHYTLRVTTFSGYDIVFKGVSGGYYGEGTRGAHDILKLFGFNEKQCNRAFEHEQFDVRKHKL